MLVMKAQAEALELVGLRRYKLFRAAPPGSPAHEEPGKTTHTASRDADQVNPMLFGSQKSRQFWQLFAAPECVAREISARGGCFRRELHESYIFRSCSPHDQLRLSAQDVHNSLPSAVAVAGFPSTREYCARAIHRRDQTASKELRHQRERRFLHCAFGDDPRHME